MTRKSANFWFRLNRTLHRDIGYLCIGLTLVFAVSGIALNHIADWNPNYIIERVEKPFKAKNTLSDEQLNEQLSTLFEFNEAIKASYWESVQQYKLFFAEGGTLTANFSRQTAVYERVTERAVFKQFNTLHLNEAKKGWVVFSDIYAGMLIFLALSALFMVKGKYSPWRLKRGWLVIVGGLIPTVYIFYV
ncbi:PepSY-associated TM helix domain-containing protein [Pseudoalteromonas sp. MMG010]|uniref:PepSY-associated TM helix domain-containing protein n=1 Tax=Pseudoalteromonas sp. MMG010 TaxID=2822685 RepID=UPI001B3A677A|nr:PepSY-associated TM helix domain-containing protein [Pseudoalteromonas sp. MMG010]MBQ4832117.1 PepSY-associated TM helix domain-containing protein [Pseudoalteromonas sp. MMG010]